MSKILDNTEFEYLWYDQVKMVLHLGSRNYLELREEVRLELKT